MIAIKEISSEEAQKLNSELSWSYWAIPIAFTIVLIPVTLVLNWLFNAPWSVFWWATGGLFMLFAVVRIINGEPPQLAGGNIKVVRQGKVIHVAILGNQPGLGRINLGQHIDVTLASEPAPPEYPAYHTFTVYQSFGMSYYLQDGSLRHRKSYLIGKEVEIEYLAQSGKVIAFRELNPASNPPTVYLRWGSIQLSRKKTILNKNRVDFVVLATDMYGNTGIFLRSDSVRDELFIPLYAINLDRFEDWLYTLEGFDKRLYLDMKENPPSEEKAIWERRVKKGVSYQSVYAGERVSLLFGGIHVYRDNGHNESIQTEEIDYITLNSLCADKPNTEFFINLRSFQSNSVSLQSRAEGFTKLERWIARLPGFQSEQYLAMKATVGEEGKVVWVRQPIANAEFVNVSNTPPAIGELARGIFMENRDTWLDWGTFGDLNRLVSKRWLTMKKTSYPNPDVRGHTYVIKKLVILGGLELESLQTETPFWWPEGKPNPDWPVTAYWSDVSFGKGGLDDFEQLTLHFTKLLDNLPDGHSDPSIDGENAIWAFWTIGRTTIKISTWKPYQLNVYKHACRLEITCMPHVEHLYTDDYTSGLTLHNQLRYLVLEGKLTVASDYTRHAHSRYTPECIARLIQPDGEYIIWIDEKHAKLGIGAKQHAQVLELVDVAGLELTGSYWRDSPRELQLHLHVVSKQWNAHRTLNYLGELDSGQGDSRWPVVREQWERFFGLPCTYTEDRQYY